MSIKVYDNEKSKNVRSENYNFDFDKKTGFFARWGKTLDEDPQVGLPEIADIEITTICKGPGNKLCNFCSPEGTKIETEFGQKNIEDIKLNDKVYSFNGQNVVLNEVVELYKHNNAKELVKIILEDGSTIELTPDHEVFLIDGTLKNAGDLVEGDDVRTYNESTL